MQRTECARLSPAQQLPAPAYATYLFDLDGTLIDTAPDIAAALNRQLATLGLAAVSVATVTTWVGTGSAQLLRTALAYHGVSYNEVMVAHLLQAYGSDYAARAVELSTPYPDAFATLRSLRARGARCALVTNKLAAVTHNVLRHFAIADLFDAVICGDDVARGKPDPMQLLMACARLNVAPHTAVMIGDSRNDVRAARAAHMPVIAVDYGYNHGEPIANAAPDLVIASLNALL